MKTILDMHTYICFESRCRRFASELESLMQLKNNQGSPTADVRVVQLKNGREITLRLLEKRDVEGVWANFNEVVDEKIYLPVYTPVVDDWEKNSWYQDMQRDNNICIIAEDPAQPSSERVVGQCTVESVEWEAASHVGVLGIIVKGSYRDLGVGFHLIMHAKAIASKRGKKKITLTTFESNDRGLSLYKKCGFQNIGKYTRQYLIEGKYLDEIIMECWLDT